MKLSFYGAAREVTGSCHGVEVNGKRILVDCGLYQGSENNYGQDFPFDPESIDYVVITHAHIDHTGRLPLLVKQGYKNKIYATGATAKLLDIMLKDSGHIQEVEAEWKNRKKKRAGGDEVEPLYTVQDAEEVLQYFVPCRYNEEVVLDEGIKIRFIDAGHILGSAFVEMWLTEGGVTKKIVFSGDIGNVGQPIIRNPQYIKQADYALMESTYGDRDHEVPADYTEDLATVIDKTLGAGGNVVIPSFAVGRTQELLYFIREIKERGLVKSAPDFPVYVDSPLANAATRIYEGDLEGYLDQETLDVLKSGKQYLSFKNLNISETADDSRAINFDKTPKVIISSSGMCEAGRIRHHLKHNLWRPECAVVFVGFQAKGTLGRILVDRAADRVTLFGDKIAVKCHIYSFRGMSAHADRAGLLKWVRAFEPKPRKVFVIHGEEDVSELFAETLTDESFDAVAPMFASSYDLLEDRFIHEGLALEQRREDAGTRRASPVYQQLISAGARLLDTITHNFGGTNKDLKTFTAEIDKLAEKWDR